MGEEPLETGVSAWPFAAAGSDGHASLEEPLERPASAWARLSWLHLAAHSMCKTHGKFNLARPYPSSVIKMPSV